MSTVNYDEKTLKLLKEAINKALKAGLQSFKVKDYPGYVEFEDPPEHYIDYVNGALMNRIEKYNKEDLEDSKNVLNNIKLAVIDPDLSDFLTDKGNTWAGFTQPDGEYPVVMKDRYRGLNTFLHEFRHNIDNIIDLTDELLNYLDNAYPEIKDIERPVVNATLRGKIIGELATSEGKYFKEIGLNLDKLDKYILSAGKEQIFNTLLHLDSEGSKYAKYLENKFGSVRNIPEYIFLNMRDAMMYVPLYLRDPFIEKLKKLLFNKKQGGIMLYFKNGRKIHIKESLKGSFTRYCGGNVTSECIARGKASPDPRIRKKATFAANARKWKHKNGGSLLDIYSLGSGGPTPNLYDDVNYDTDDTFDPSTIEIDPEILKPYNRFTFGLPENYDRAYVGKRAGSDPTWDLHVNIVKSVYGLLLTALKNNYSNYNSTQINILADAMTRHYISENGWVPPEKVKRIGGFGKAKTIAEWVAGMKEWYPNSMKASDFKGYINGLKANKQGNRYNSEFPDDTYYNNMYKLFGPNTRVDRILRQILNAK